MSWNARYADHLRQTGAQVKCLSLEPLLSPIPRLDLQGIDWVIVGGGRAAHARGVGAGDS